LELERLIVSDEEVEEEEDDDDEDEISLQFIGNHT
jgi:hypothetical protein